MERKWFIARQDSGSGSIFIRRSTGVALGAIFASELIKLGLLVWLVLYGA